MCLPRDTNHTRMQYWLQWIHPLSICVITYIDVFPYSISLKLAQPRLHCISIDAFTTLPTPLTGETHRISVEYGVSGNNGFRLLERDGATSADGEGRPRSGGVAVKSHRLGEAETCCAIIEFRRCVWQGACVLTVFISTIWLELLHVRSSRLASDPNCSIDGGRGCRYLRSYRAADTEPTR